MFTSSSFRRLLTLSFAAALVAGCTVTPDATPVASKLAASHDAIAKPALIAVNYNTKALEYWPISPSGGNHPTAISPPGLFNGFGMVAHGHVVAFASQSPAGVLEFDVATKSMSTLPDPYGTPADIAIGKDASLYVVNINGQASNVTMYPGGSSTPKELNCQYLEYGEQVAVDNEGDIFVNGYNSDNTTGVVEIPNGPNGPEPDKCFELHLQQEDGYAAGLAIDPKTDALIVLNNPDLCAGGEEGRMTIYGKPYRAKTARVHDVGKNCSGGIRLNADSTIVFVLDQDFAGVNSFVLQRSFPDGGRLGEYRGGESNSITTIPNTLPN